MERKLHQEPAFDHESLWQRLDEWHQNGAKRVFIEWSTGTGPTLFCFPAGERRFGFKWTVDVDLANYNELYADYIERTLVPSVAGSIKARKMDPTVFCVDLQPLQVQRQRRRQIERAQATVAHH